MQAMWKMWVGKNKNKNTKKRTPFRREQWGSMREWLV